MKALDSFVADAILGIDTLWGGDVMNPSGTGRFIADSWFSDEPLPTAYTHASAARVRETGGVGAKEPDRAAIEEYLTAVDVHGAIAGMAAEGKAAGGRRAAYLEGLALCFEAMWGLAMEILGKGEPVPYERCVNASTGRPPEPSRPEPKRLRVAELLARSGHASDTPEGLLAAVDAWRRDRVVPGASISALASAFIAEFDALTARNLVPHLARSDFADPRPPSERHDNTSRRAR